MEHLVEFEIFFVVVLVLVFFWFLVFFFYHKNRNEADFVQRLLNMYRGISTRWLFIHCFQIELEFRSVDFCEGRKTGEPGEKPRSRDKNQQQTQPTCDAGSGNRTRATAVGGECSHHCVIPASLCYLLSGLISAFLISGN